MMLLLTATEHHITVHYIVHWCILLYRAIIATVYRHYCPTERTGINISL